MCGIFGYNGSKPTELAKMKLLGIYNVSRGRHSCGYYYDGELRHGVDKAKEWTDFITDGMTIKKEKSKGAKVFIGHTRSATVGTHVINNAHPFKVENYIQAHNGTLENAFDLCNKYGIDHTEINVDSLALAHLIKKEGWKILDEYVGYAALLMTFEDEPDALYAYHGASRKEAEKEIFEERPLFIMEGRTGMYFSSLEDSLMAIRDTIQQEPEKLACNKVYKFKNGQFDSIVYEVNRLDNNLKFLAKKEAVVQGFFPGAGTGYKQKEMFPKAGSTPSLASPIFHESKPKEASIPNKAWFWKGRYWKCVDNNEFPLLLDGVYHICRGGDIILKGDKHSRKAQDYYFIQGNMMPSLKVYNKVRILENQDMVGIAADTRVKFNYAFLMSKFTKYAVTNLESEALDCINEHRFRWFKNEKSFTGTICPKFGSRQYEILDGRLKKIHRADGDKVFVSREVAAENSTPEKSPMIVDDKGNIMVRPLPTELNVVKALPVNDEEPISQEVRTIMDLFNIVFINLDEVTNLPEPVYGAIENYTLDYLESKLSKESFDKMSTLDKDEYYQNFLINAVRDGNSFLQQMASEFRVNLQYYVEVAIHELEKAERSKVKVAQPKEIETEFDVETTEDLSDNDFTVDDIVETEQARKQFNELLDRMIEFNKYVDDMQKLDSSDLAQDIAWAGYNTVDMFKSLIIERVNDKEIKQKLKALDVPF